MSASLVPVPVPGTDTPIQAIQIDGRAFVALRPLCDSLGIDTDSQAKKLRSRSWATTVLKTVVAGDGRSREMLLIDRATMTMWLATLDERRVSEQIRPMVIAYQREATDALDAYFNGRTGAAPAMNQLDVLRAAIDQIEAAQREAAEAKIIAQRTDERLAAIEGRHDWLSALAYARINELPTHTRFLQRLGSCASRIAKAHDVEPNKVQHQLYGAVNSYPVWVWELAAEGFGA